MNRLTAYLAGAIRDGHPEDIEWREEFITALETEVDILNPLGNKAFNPTTGEWTVSNIRTTSQHIVRQDFWCVDHADILIANLLPQAKGYPSIGTMMELGRASGNNCLVYAAIDPEHQSTPNPGVFKMHPFLEQIVAQAFPTLHDMLAFLVAHIPMLSGDLPRWKGERS